MRRNNKTNIVEIPDPSGKYLAKRNGEWHSADILQKRPKQDQNIHEYYVHFTGCDRRLDRWLPETDVEFIPVNRDDDDASSACTALSAYIPAITERKLTRTQKKRLDEISETLAESQLEPSEQSTLEDERQALTRIKYINEIQIGKWIIETWYFSPYPEESGKCQKLWICEFCLLYLERETLLVLHKRHCERKNPPGNVVYNSGNVSIYEVDGKLHMAYCQCLCLLAKLFLDHKTLYYDVEGFKFYIMCVSDAYGRRPIVGYFSKEKNSPDCFNVACLLVLPPYQNRGYGRLLISFSYELSKTEGVVAGPETPLSDLGLLAYRSYWSWVLLHEIHDAKNEITFNELSHKTCISEIDIKSTLCYLDLVKHFKRNDCVCINKSEIRNIMKRLKPPKYRINSLAIAESLK